LDGRDGEDPWWSGKIFLFPAAVERVEIKHEVKRFCVRGTRLANAPDEVDGSA
jgi:hypothetical protein